MSNPGVGTWSGVIADKSANHPSGQGQIDDLAGTESAICIQQAAGSFSGAPDGAQAPVIVIGGGTGGGGSIYGSLTLCGGPDIFATYQLCTTRDGSGEPSGAAGTYRSGGRVKLSGTNFANATHQIQFVAAGDPTSCTSQVFTDPDDQRILAKVSGPSFSVGPLPVPSPTSAGTAQVCVVQLGTSPPVGNGVDLTIAPADAPRGFTSSCFPNRTSDYVEPPNSISYFDGWETPLTSPSTLYTGVRADIVNYSPTHSPALNNNTASAWVMLALSGSGQNHAQVGWLELGDRSRHTFWEWTDSTATVGFRRRVRAPLLGSSRYGVVYSNSTGQFSFEVNGATMGTATTNPPFIPDVAQNYGETKSQASQMPGGTLGTEVFDAASVRVNDGSWQPLNGLTFAVRQLPNGTVQGVDFFHNRRVSSSRIEIGDKACQI